MILAERTNFNLNVCLRTPRNTWAGVRTPDGR
jgi:hypothetical protein